MRWLLRTAVALMPLAAGLALLRYMPEARQTQVLRMGEVTWSLDALTLVAVVLVALGAARPRASLWGTLRLAAGVVGVASAIGATTPLLRLLSLSVASLLLIDGLSVRWFLALGMLAVAELLPQAAPLIGLADDRARALLLPALIVAALLGAGGVPWSPRGAGSSGYELVLRPVWLVPLLRSLEAGPWPLPAVLSVPLLGAALAALAAIEVLAIRDRRRGAERLLAAMLLWAFACVGLSTTLGVVAALWVLLAHALAVLWMGENGEMAPAAMLVPLFAAAWWSGAALAGARAWLPAGVVWFAGIAGGGAFLLEPMAAPPPRTSVRIARWHRRTGAVARGILLLLLALFAPLMTRFAGLRVADQLGAGLTAYGLIDIRPWIGIGALDAANRRVALLPSVALLPLLLVTLAVTWLVLRVLGRRTSPAPRGYPPPLQGEGSDSPPSLPGKGVGGLGPFVRRRVWWVRAERDG